MSPRRTSRLSDTETSVEIEDKQEVVVEAPTETKEMKATTAHSSKVPVQVVRRPLRKVSFEQWARARGVKQHHKGGLKAHVPNHKVPRSYEDWDKIFADY